MKKSRIGTVFVVSCLVWGLTAFAAAIDDEMEGLESAVSTKFAPHAAAAPLVLATRDEALARLSNGGLLLIPESTNDRVMAFDPYSGDLVYADFIPADPAHLSTPIHAMLTPDGSTLLVSDQIEDVVQSYDVLTGAFSGTFAPVGGPDNSILDNIRGMAFTAEGHLLVTVAGGANANAVAEFDAAGAYLGNLVAGGSGGLNSPFDILHVGSGYLVDGISSDAIHRYDLAGNSLGNFAGIDTFPEQMFRLSNGNLLVGNFGGTQEGVVELDNSGALVGIYNPVSLGEYRGVYELGNGNILTTNGDGVHEIDRGGNLVETKISGVSARFIQYVATQATQVPLFSPWQLALMTLLFLLAGGFTLRRQSGAGF